MTAIHKHLPKICLNNTLNYLVKKKKNRLDEWIEKQILSFFCLHETHLLFRDRQYIRVKAWKKNTKKIAGSNHVLASYYMRKRNSNRNSSNEAIILIKGLITQEIYYSNIKYLGTNFWVTKFYKKHKMALKSILKQIH